MTPSTARSEEVTTGAARTESVEGDGASLSVLDGGLATSDVGRDIYVRQLITTRDRLRAGVRRLKAEGEDALRRLEESRAETQEARARAQAAESAAAQAHRSLEAQTEERLNALNAQHEEAMTELRADMASQLQQANKELRLAQQSVRELRLELGREKRTAYDTAVATLRPAHLKEVAKHRQIGKKAGVAVTMAYLEASKAEGGDLGRVSELASRVLIKGAEAFGAREAENAATEVPAASGE